MNKKARWIVVAALLAISLVALLRHRGNMAAPAVRRTDGAPAEPDQAATPEPSPATPYTPSATSPRPNAAPSRATQALSARGLALAEWQAHINFYGRVVDETSNSVSGVSVHFCWTDEEASPGIASTAEALTDSNGVFSLEGKRGASLTVWVSKDGYYASRGGQRSFSYALANEIHSPDPQDPVIFLLRRKGQGAELVTSENGIRPDLAIRVPRDGTPLRVDLFQKKMSPIGQIEIRQNKPPWQQATNWSFSLRIADGGLVENQDQFPFEAPETNYQAAADYEFAKSETNWITHVTRQFYIVFGEPRRYGWLRIESNLDQETVFLTYAINPTGSRNLEPLQAKPQAPLAPPWLPPEAKAVVPEFK